MPIPGSPLRSESPDLVMRIFHLPQALVSHVKHANLIGRAIPVLYCPKDTVGQAVLEKRAGFYFSNLDTYVNVIGGLRLDEPAVGFAASKACRIRKPFKSLGTVIPGMRSAMCWSGTASL